MSKETLLDKIRGGWAGQTFGCAYGGPTEFRFNGMTVPDSVSIPWSDDRIEWWFDNEPGIFDDVYMDLTFVDVFDKYGLDAPVDSMASAFAHATYNLWHANQAARYNILNGLRAPESGHWKNNPHADDIDFQIEADFAGLMSPGMPDSASRICDGIGHIMNYGNGWYGGVYIAAMYSLAFVSDDVEYIVTEALKTIPVQSTYHQCIADAIRRSKENADWRATWKSVNDKWGNKKSCPLGIHEGYRIEAMLNSAWVVIGLLYGGGDMDRTIDIATRCGDDSDCNPASAAGILGTMLGYSNIPEKWIAPVRRIEGRNFAHTDISLEKACRMSFDQAVGMIERGGGSTDGDSITIEVQTPHPVRFERSFESLSLVSNEIIDHGDFRNRFKYEFEGTGIVCEGALVVNRDATEDISTEYVARLEVEIDGKKEVVEMPADFATRRFDIYWNYGLTEGKHVMKMLWLNPVGFADVRMVNIVVYTTETSTAT